jgi:hypothetical protein
MVKSNNKARPKGRNKDQGLELDRDKEMNKDRD